MKYYSELTDNLYDTQEELEMAEQKEQKKKEQEKVKKAERAAAAKEVEKAFLDADAAKKSAMDKLTDFCVKYGSFRTSIDSDTLNGIKPSIFSQLFDMF